VRVLQAFIKQPKLLSS